MPGFDKGNLHASSSQAASQTDAAFAPAISASTTGGRVVIKQLVIVNGATGTSTLALNSKGSGAGTLLTGFPASFILPASTAFVLPYSDAGYWLGNVNEGITVTTGAGNTTNAFFIVTYNYVY